MSNQIRSSDINTYLTGNPQITFFKTVYRKHTPFLKFIEEVKNETHKLDKGNTIPRYHHTLIRSKFDLISDIFLKHKLTFKGNNTIYANIGNNLIDNIRLNIGSTELYKTTGFIMEMISELEYPFIPSMCNGYICPPYLDTNTSGSLTVNTGNNYNISCFAGGVSGSTTTSEIETETFFTRPNFDFCKSYDKSFPLCALIHSDVKFHVDYNPSNVSGSFSNASLSRTIVIEGIALSNDEKRRVISNTGLYMYYDIKLQSALDFPTLTPIRTIYIVKTPDKSAGSASLSFSTPRTIPDSDFNTFSITTDALSHRTSGDNKNILTKYNIHRYYGDNTFGGRDLIVPDKSNRRNRGFLSSIAVFSAGLENSDSPNGHFSSGSRITISTGDSTSNTQICSENINFYQIISGHLGKLIH
mgnify:CR=1 FL=1|jgi:hypothetical protein